MTVLLWGLPAERALAAVRTALASLGARAVVLDQRAVLEASIEVEVASDVRGTLRTDGRSLDLATIRAAYLRPYALSALSTLSAVGRGSVAWDHALGVHRALLSWAGVAPALVVNRPGAGAANGSKPYQADLIRRHGLAVPDTLITTDPDAARDFWDRHGEVVYKSISGVRSVVSRLTPAGADRLADVAFCPTQFQQYVPGRDVRVHVIGHELFACEVISTADDYRYPGRHPVAIRACRLPTDVADRCRTLAADLGLCVAGIDLRLTPAGAWYCFEVNPAPAFPYYERSTGQPIGQAIARLLATGG